MSRVKSLATRQGDCDNDVTELHRLRGEFEGGAEVVFAEVAGDAVEIALAVEDDAVEGRYSSAGLREVVEHSVFPSAVGLRG